LSIATAFRLGKLRFSGDKQRSKNRVTEKSTGPAARQENAKNRACSHCGHTDHSTKDCRYKAHPNANQDENVPWHKSEAMQAQLKARCRRKTPNGYYVLEIDSVARQDDSGNYVAEPTPDDVKAKFSRAEKPKAGHTRSSTPKSEISTSRGAKKTRFEKGKSQDTINEISQDNLVDSAKTESNLTYSQWKMKEGTSDEDMQIDPKTGKPYKMTPCWLKSGKNAVWSKFFPDPGATEWNLSGSFIDEDYFSKINETLKCRVFTCEDTAVSFAVKDAAHKIVNKYIYLNVEYKSRETFYTMQACLKFYLIKDLASKVKKLSHKSLETVGPTTKEKDFFADFEKPAGLSGIEDSVHIDGEEIEEALSLYLLLSQED
jgi:hypothetical protein